MASSYVVVYRDCHSAGSPEKACAESTRYFCCAGRSGVCGGLDWGLGPRGSVGSEYYTQTIPAACHAFLAVNATDHSGSMQFLFAFRKSDDNGAWTTDLRAAISSDCLCISADFSPR